MRLIALCIFISIATSSYSAESLTLEQQQQFLESAHKHYYFENIFDAMTEAEKAAEAGYAEAQMFYAFLLRLGNANQQAFDWYSKAAAQGSEESYFEMARIILDGEIEGIGVEQAISFLKKGAENNNESALRLLYQVNKNGRSDWPANQTAALSWLTIGLQVKQVWAMYLWAEILESGEMDQTQNHQQAMYWLAQAGEAGSSEAINKLMLIYDRGLFGEERDKSKVKYWQQVIENQSLNQ